MRKKWEPTESIAFRGLVSYAGRMSQSNALCGAPEQLAQLPYQFNALYQTEDLVIVGGFGAAALYQTFGWEAPPLSLLNEERRFRKIEVMTTAHSIKHEEYKGAVSLLDISPAVESTYFELGLPGAPALIGPAHKNGVQGTRYLFDPAILTPRERQLDGMPIRTLSVGAHLLLAKLIRSGQGSDDTPSPLESSSAYRQRKKGNRENRKYLEEFTEFAGAMRESHPEEFPGLGQEMVFRLAIESYTDRNST